MGNRTKSVFSRKQDEHEKQIWQTCEPGSPQAQLYYLCYPQCEEIERDFINWKSPTAIATECGIADRATVYRHAHAFDLSIKRTRNVRAALEKIIERVGEVDVTAAAVVAAIQAHAKINAQGQWIDRTEHIDLNALFDRMSKDELEAYARDGKLPDWFTQTLSGAFLSATADDSQEDGNEH